MSRPRAADGRWRTTLGAFVSDFGVANLCRAFAAHNDSLTPAAVSRWLSGETSPRRDHGDLLVVLSEGRLRFDDVYVPRRGR